MAKWKFFADRGGTFTDLVAVTDNREAIERLKGGRFLIVPLPGPQWVIVYKLLSENPQQYSDAVIQGIRDILALGKNELLPTEAIEVVKMGTTVATNALLERKGDRVVLLITKGFKDALRIGYQNRPDIFAREIVLPTMLYEEVIEVTQRYDSHGNELIPLDTTKVRNDLEQAYGDGFRSCAIVLMHSYRYPQPELDVAAIARAIGFTQVSVSHQVSPLIKLVSRGDTTVVDAYLSPILRRYVNQVASFLPGVRLMFMKSDGGLVNAEQFQGKDSILSGPAGGIVGAVECSKRAGFEQIITFDMGGTSTDVAHFKGEYERELETEIAGARMRVPVLAIHTIAAGGGSILFFDGFSYRVGPESAGANPGPACYRRGGPLTVTDANVMLGKIYPQYFPSVFGVDGNSPLDKDIVLTKFTELVQEVKQATGVEILPADLAAGFIAIAVENMANAIKKISLQRGYDVTNYTLCGFGGATGQVACLIADTLGIGTIFFHPYSGVLSAYGMGLAALRAIREAMSEWHLNAEVMPQLEELLASLKVKALKELDPNEAIKEEKVIKKLNLKYEGTNSILMIDFKDDFSQIKELFEAEHLSRYGFIQPEKSIIVESVSVEVIQMMDTPTEAEIEGDRDSNILPQPRKVVQMYSNQEWVGTPVFLREDLQPEDIINGPAIIVEKIGTIVVEKNWQGRLTKQNHLILSKVEGKRQ